MWNLKNHQKELLYKSFNSTQFVQIIFISFLFYLFLEFADLPMDFWPCVLVDRDASTIFCCYFHKYFRFGCINFCFVLFCFFLMFQLKGIYWMPIKKTWVLIKNLHTWNPFGERIHIRTNWICINFAGVI